MYPTSPIQLPTSDYYYDYTPIRDGNREEDESKKRRKNEDDVIPIGDPAGLH